MPRRDVLAFLLAACALSAARAQSAGDRKYRLVIQVSDADAAKWNLALNNARNVQEDVGADNVRVEIVAYGPGIGMLKIDATTSARVEDAVKAGVRVLACENTMRAQKLTRDDMNPAVGYVPAGVGEILRKQSEGWAYLRP